VALSALHAKSVLTHNFTYSQVLSDAGRHQIKTVTVGSAGDASGSQACPAACVSDMA